VSPVPVSVPVPVPALPEVTDDDDEFYEVERIVDRRTLPNGAIEYLLKWAGCSDSLNTWEPLENVSDPDLIVHFEKTRRQMF
jgi:hypothetical protein